MLKISIISLFLILLNTLNAESWELLYQGDNNVVNNMKSSNFTSDYHRMLYSLSGVNGGVGFYDYETPDSLKIYTYPPFQNGTTDVCADEENNRILCTFGDGSYSDGIYSFDMESRTFELVDYFMNPSFIKKMNDGFYVGGGLESLGLFYSSDGDNWNELDYFNDKNVTDIEETYSNNDLFISTAEAIYLKNGDSSYSSFTTNLNITDIYVVENGSEVFISCGAGSYSDCVYEVEYSDGEITDLKFINYFIYPSKLYDYDEYLVVGSNNNNNGLHLVEKKENGNKIEIGEDYNFGNVYSFERHPINCANFLVSTDAGIYLAKSLETGIEDNYELQITNYELKQNYPNPFNPITKIRYAFISTLRQAQYGAPLNDLKQVEIVVYNTMGQKVWSSPVTRYESPVTGSYSFDGTKFNSGVYYYSLVVDGIVKETKSMLLIK